MFHARLVTAAAVLAASVAAAAPAAQAAPPSSKARFLTSIKLTQTATFDEPRHFTGADCFHRFWREMKAKETWTVSARPKVLGITRVGSNAIVDFGGRLDDLASLIPGLDARSAVSRDADITTGSEPGDCGGSGGMDPAPLTRDCGARTFDSVVMLEFQRGKVTPLVGEAPTSEGKSGYDDCPLPYPASASAGFNEVGQDLPVRDLMDPEQRLHVVFGNKTFREKGDGWTATLRVHWELRMKRVR